MNIIVHILKSVNMKNNAYTQAGICVLQNHRLPKQAHTANSFSSAIREHTLLTLPWLCYNIDLSNYKVRRR